MLNKFITYTKNSCPIIEGPYDDFKLEARVSELLEDKEVRQIIITAGNEEKSVIDLGEKT